MSHSLPLERDDDDEQTLAAALAFVEEFELSEEADQGRQEDSERGRLIDEQAPRSSNGAIVPSKRNSTRRRTSAFDPNRARAKGKRELMYLRNKVRVLDAELAALQSGERSSSSARSLVASSLLHTHKLNSLRTLTRGGRMPITNPPRFVWEEIAMRQYAGRQKAEVENLRLRAMLEGQIKIAKGLESMLKKRSNEQMLQLYSDGTLPFARRCYETTTDEDAAIFAMLLSDIDKSLEEVDLVFATNGLSKTELPFQDAFVTDNDLNEIYLEVFANKILPLDVQATSDAVWLHLSVLIERMPFRSYYDRRPKQMETTADTIVESFGVEIHAKRTTGHFRIRQAMRRYDQEDRILIAWRMTLDPVEYSSQRTCGMRFYEKGYIVLKRPQAEAQKGFTLMQTCFIVYPQQFESGNVDHESQLRELARFFLDCTTRNVFMSGQMIEDFLMDQAMNR